MGFYQKYELLELAKDDGIKAFVAREKVNGRMVLVHLFTAGKTPETVALLQQAASLPADRRQYILDQGENDGTPYLVTPYAQDLQLRSLLTPPPVSAIPFASKTRRDSNPLWREEYERIRRTFLVPDRGTGTRSTARPDESAVLSRDFTTLVGMPAPGSSAAAAPPAKPTPPNPEYRPDATQRLDMPQLGLASRPAAPPAPAAAAAMNETVALPRPAAGPLPAPPPPAPPVPAPPAPAADNGEFTKLLKTTQEIPTNPAAWAPPPPPPAATALPPLPMAPAPQAAAAPAARRNLLPVIVGLVVICLALVGAIVLVVLRRAA